MWPASCQTAQSSGSGPQAELFGAQIADRSQEQAVVVRPPVVEGLQLGRCGCHARVLRRSGDATAGAITAPRP